MATISGFKNMMTKKAQKAGEIWEDFGQKELCELKDKVGYNPFGNQKERAQADQIDQLDNWCMNFTL